MDVQRHITADDIRYYRHVPGVGTALPIPAVSPMGVTAFNQTAPFIDVPEATGRSDFRLGVKFNIFRSVAAIH